MSAIRLNYSLLRETEEGNALSRKIITTELFEELGPEDWIELNGVRCNNPHELEQAFNKAKDENEKSFSLIASRYKDIMNRWNLEQ